MVQANIGKDLSGRIVVSFPYDPLIVAKIKTIEGRRWNAAEKHWSFPNLGTTTLPKTKRRNF